MPDNEPGVMRGVELARTGTWDLSTGTVEFTRRKFTDAVEFYQASGKVPIPVKLGHLTLPEGFTDWDGLPSFGLVDNPRINPADPDSLVGDVTDMPQWLHAAAPRSWPSRSIEAFENVAYKGRTYQMVLSGLALLGVTPPGVKDIRSLRDLQLAVAASSGARFIAAAAPTPAPTAPVEEPVTQPASEPATAPPTEDPNVHPDVAPSLPAQPVAPALPAPAPAGPVSAQPPIRPDVPTPVVTPADPAPVAPAAPVTPVQPTTTAPVTPATEPPATPGPIPIPEKEDGMADLRAGLRELVGVKDDVNDDALIAAMREALTERAEPIAASGFVAPKGFVLIPDVAYRDMLASTEQGVIAAAAHQHVERDRVLDEALRAGKMRPASLDDWRKHYDIDPEGTKAHFASASQIVPVMASGYTGKADEDPDEALDRALFGASQTAKVG